MPATPDGRPSLSVLLITPGGYGSIRAVVDSIRAQRVRDRIEIVILAPRETEVEPDRAALEAFHGWQIVEVGPIDELGSVEATGIRRARADVVVYVEEHSFPRPGWAEALLLAHAGPWAAVGPALSNANPRTGVSWVSFLLDFGEWVGRDEPGPASLLASHQTSYKRDPLIRYGPELERLIETETMLQKDLRENGHELYFEPTAVTDHVNVSRLRSLVTVEYHNYRAFAASRAEQGDWSWRRRLLYVAGAPLIPLVRGCRQVRPLARSGLTRGARLRILPAFAVALAAAAAGELMGYAVGPGDSRRKRVSAELSRWRHVTDSDCREVFER